MSKKELITKQPEISNFVKDGTLETQISVRDNLALAFPVTDIKSLVDAEMLMDGAFALSSRLSLVSCKVAEKVYNEELWKNGTYLDNAGKSKHYVNFEQWTMRKYNISRTAAFLLRKVAILVSEDGVASLLPHTTKYDFSYSQLAEFAICPLFVKYEKLDGDDKRKTTRTFLDKDGKPVSKLEESYLYELCLEERLTPAMTIKGIRETLKKLSATDVDGDELITETTDETTDEITEITDENTATPPKVYKIGFTAEMLDVAITCIDFALGNAYNKDFIAPARELLSILNTHKQND